MTKDSARILEDGNIFIPWVLSEGESVRLIHFIDEIFNQEYLDNNVFKNEKYLDLSSKDHIFIDVMTYNIALRIQKGLGTNFKIFRGNKPIDAQNLRMVKSQNFKDIICRVLSVDIHGITVTTTGYLNGDMLRDAVGSEDYMVTVSNHFDILHADYGLGTDLFWDQFIIDVSKKGDLERGVED